MPKNTSPDRPGQVQHPPGAVPDAVRDEEEAGPPAGPTSDIDTTHKLIY